MEKKYVHKILIAEKSIDDLDWLFLNEFGVDENCDEELGIIEQGNYGTDAHIINIDRMIAELYKLKHEGSTHVAIDYHCDHIGYDIAGFFVRKSTDSEIDDFEEKKRLKNEREQKRLELLKQLQVLDREIKPINNSEDLPF